MDEMKIAWVVGRGIPLPGDDIDTDRIIPARFMRCVTFDGLGQYAFYDERFDSMGRPKAHPLNDPRYRGGEILVVGKNFGCGSSREHAPQALRRFGIRAIVGESFAEIFAGNCTALGMPVVQASGENIRQLIQHIQESPKTEIRIDLEALQVVAGDLSFPIQMPETARRAFVEGLWDTTALLLAHREAIRQKAKTLPYLSFPTKGI